MTFKFYNQIREDGKANDIAALEIFDTLGGVFKYYSKLHKKDKNRKVAIGDTREEKLMYKIERKEYCAYK